VLGAVARLADVEAGEDEGLVEPVLLVARAKLPDLAAVARVGEEQGIALACRDQHVLPA
jgi:hypothetical protein